MAGDIGADSASHSSEPTVAAITGASVGRPTAKRLEDRADRRAIVVGRRVGDQRRLDVLGGRQAARDGRLDRRRRGRSGRAGPSGGAAAAPRPSPDRLRAFSIADIAAETASFAGCFCAIVPALSLIAAASP